MPAFRTRGQIRDTQSMVGTTLTLRGFRCLLNGYHETTPGLMFLDTNAFRSEELEVRNMAQPEHRLPTGSRTRRKSSTLLDPGGCISATRNDDPWGPSPALWPNHPPGPNPAPARAPDQAPQPMRQDRPCQPPVGTASGRECTGESVPRGTDRLPVPLFVCTLKA